MEALDKVFKTEKKCKEHDCAVNNKNVKVIYKPDNGFLDKKIEKETLGVDYKICDCIIECEDGSFFIVEILCGKLTNRELKEKTEQLTNCFKVMNHLGEEKNVKKLFLFYKTLESKKREPLLRKRIINQRINNSPFIITNNKVDISC